MKNLITGINGFAASHLADHLLQLGEEVFGLARNPRQNANIRHQGNKIQVFPGDIRHSADLEKVIAAVRPQRIYHLAAVSFVPAAEKDTDLTREVNLHGTTNLLETIINLGLETRVLYVGSSEEYGPSAAGASAIAETRSLNPQTPYGISKAQAEQQVKTFVERQGLDAVLARPFNHIGPRQDSRFVSASFARQIAEIEAGAEPLIRVGNLEARRDFSDVRDTVRAYHQLMEQGQTGQVYNVCSGKPVKIKYILDTLCDLSAVAISVEVDPERYRPEKPVDFFGDPQRLIQETKWEPKIPLKQTLKDISQYWKQAISHS